LFDTAIDSLHRAGNIVLLALTLASLAAFFARVDQPDVAAIVYGTSTYSTNLNLVTRLPSVLDHLRAVLSPTAFDDYVATGAAMDLADAVHYARHNIQLTRQQLEDG
jgi:hypothetical protein